jgi:uncharacterized protein YdeI (YjbR/CyaY-like superfamily)
VTEQPRLVVRDQAAWRAWLDAHEEDSDGVWLVLGKKGFTEPTTLTYAQALDEALCSGWIDGQVKRIDEASYMQRFTPRRARSLWSVRNTEHVARLAAEGRVRPRGQREIERAQSDGRWDQAYHGPAAITEPAELLAALGANPAAERAYADLTKQERYALLHQIQTARTERTRAARIARIVERLAGRSAGE